MKNIESDTCEIRGVLSVDTTSSGIASRRFDIFRRCWESQFGDRFPLAIYSPETIADFRINIRATRVRDVIIEDLRAASSLWTADPPGGDKDLVELHVLRHGAWTVGELPDIGEYTVSAGQFLLRHFSQQAPFKRAAHTNTQSLTLPSSIFRTLLGDRTIIGSAKSAEVRMLMAHAHTTQRAITDLGSAGVYAAHSVLIELAKAVAQNARIDDVEPQFAPALVQAAKDLANSKLSDSELSSTMLARQLNVSVRTLQRAFAAEGESVANYIRRRRLEEARIILTAPRSRLTVSELAAHWQFADSSHFIRAFKKHYGQTPTDHIRFTQKFDSATHYHNGEQFIDLYEDSITEHP